MARTREFNDAAFKRWFDRKRMVKLLRGFAPATVADFATLEQLPTSYVDDALTQGQGGAAWRVRFRGAADEWLFLLILRSSSPRSTATWRRAFSPARCGCVRN